MAADRSARSKRYPRTPNWWYILTPKKKCLVIVIVLLILTILALVIFLLVRSTSKEAFPLCLTRECIESAEMLRDSLDFTVDPCQDFYKFTCGNFLKQYSVVPDPEFPFWNPTIMLTIEARTAVKNVLKGGDVKGQTQAAAKLTLAYTSCIKSLSSDEGGIQRLSEAMRREGFSDWPRSLDHWQDDYFDLEDILSSLWVDEIKPLISNFFTKDMENTYFKYWLHLGKPNEIFEDPEAVKNYAAFMEDILSRFNITNIKALVEDIVQFEKKLNVILARKNLEINAGEMYLEDMDSLFPGINMTRLFTLIVQKSGSTQNPTELPVIPFLELPEMLELLRKTPRRTLYGYLAWQFIYEMSLYASPTLRRLRQLFDLSWKKDARKERIRPTWQACIFLVYPHFQEALTIEYARVMFNQRMYKELREYLKNIKDSFSQDLSKQDWLDHKTIEMTKEKVNNLSIVIGYPPSLMDPNELNKIYENITVKSDDFLFNLLQFRKNKEKNVLERLGTNETERRWEYNPMDINAFNNIYKNVIVLPISILYPPYFQLRRPKYLNYGAIGFVISHELGHSFDNNGITIDFNKENSLGWWDESMQKIFLKRAQCYVDQFSNYTFTKVDPPGKLNGTNTLPENIADDIGLQHSFKAYKEYERIHGSEPGLPGLNLTNHQLFFIQFAQSRCTTYTPLGARLFFKDVHTPNEFRIPGAVVNSMEFAEVFNCPRGTPMNPESKCKIWL